MSENKGKTRGILIKIGILIGIIALVVGVFQLTPLDTSDFTPTNIKNFIQNFGILAPFIFILIYALRAVVLIIPVGVMSWVGGLAFGIWWGTALILIGATLGSSLSFLVARYFGRDFIERFEWLHKGRIKKFDDSIAQNGFKVILFMRLIPLFQYDAVNFGSGLSKIRFRDYLLATFIGMIPGGFVNALVGDSLGDPLSVQFLIAVGAFVILMLVPTIYKLIQRKRGKVNALVEEEIEKVS